MSNITYRSKKKWQRFPPPERTCALCLSLGGANTSTPRSLTAAHSVYITTRTIRNHEKHIHPQRERIPSPPSGVIFPFSSSSSAFLSSDIVIQQGHYYVLRSTSYWHSNSAGVLFECLCDYFNSARWMFWTTNRMVRTFPHEQIRLLSESSYDPPRVFAKLNAMEADHRFPKGSKLIAIHKNPSPEFVAEHDLILCHFCRSPDCDLIRDSVSRLHFSYCQKCKASRSLDRGVSALIPFNCDPENEKPKWLIAEVELCMNWINFFPN